MKYLILIPFLIACQGKSGGSSDVSIEKLEVSQDVQMSAHVSSEEIILSDILPAGTLGSDCGPSPESGKPNMIIARERGRKIETMDCVVIHPS